MGEEEIKYAELKETGNSYIAIEGKNKKTTKKKPILLPGSTRTTKDRRHPPDKLSRSKLQTAKMKALEEGDIDFSLCFPVTFGTFHEQDANAGEPEWTPVSYKLLKELKAACAQYGILAPYTLALADLLTNHWMTPYDWFQVAKSCLSGGQWLS